MKCPNELAEAILEIMRLGILNARALAWKGDAAGSAVHTDHIHNLPELLADFRPELLSCYLNAAVPAFRLQARLDQIAPFEPHWELLAASETESLAAH